MFRKWWKYSRWRFYYLNLKWNYSFWLGCRKIYKKVYYKKEDDTDFHIDPYTGKMKFKTIQVSTKRFEGFMYKGMIVDDNPGFPIDRDTWVKWKKKGFIKT